ncbi:MAG: superoxide dismutase [Micavibrio sp.]|nr:superoxide dismutase [Micavibrio sp.]
MPALKLPELPYAYDALDPYMSAETLEFHHDKHHNAYVTKGNELLEGTGQENASLEEAMVWSFKNKPGLFNQLGQHYNHIHFWNVMKENGGGTKLPSEVEKLINDSFGSYDGFKDEFTKKGAGQFGSGWVWMALSNEGKLEITGLPNGENPLVHGSTPLLGCDVWEHSYYIDYRNARPKYLEAFVDNLINWDYVAELLSKAK